MEKNIKRASFINSKLLGRTREVIERIVLQEEMDVLPLIKEQETETTVDRNAVIEECMPLLSAVDTDVTLDKDRHRMYLNMAFSSKLPPQMTALDASQPWMLYWISNSLYLMNREWLEDDVKVHIAEKLFAIASEEGLFAGGVGQLPHIAATYASINALSLCDNIDNCWDQINKEEIYKWLLSIKQSDGGFKTCYNVGETDTRAVYCALSIASLLNIITDELTEKVINYLVNCQNFEGGFGGCPHEDEAHGGYTFCAVASLAILGKLDQINIPKLIEWCATKQYNEEKGFCGRSNKLVDGCYSFWVGGTIAILEAYGYGDYIMDHNALREYILRCCQDENFLGLRDKPGKHPDFYHTNYVLAGLSTSEFAFEITNPSDPCTIIAKARAGITQSNILPVSPVYGIPIEKAQLFRDHFK